jgi:riboflavin synthase alpha subunit
MTLAQTDTVGGLVGLLGPYGPYAFIPICVCVTLAVGVICLKIIGFDFKAWIGDRRENRAHDITIQDQKTTQVVEMKNTAQIMERTAGELRAGAVIVSAAIASAERHAAKMEALANSNK